LNLPPGLGQGPEVELPGNCTVDVQREDSTDMAKDYYPLLKRAIGQLEGNTRETRSAFYQRARTVLIDQLQKRQTPPLEMHNELLALEEAVRKVETEAAPYLQEADEGPAARLESRPVPARLAADPQEAVAELERDPNGRRRHRWPAFIHARPQPYSSPIHAERLKRFAVVQPDAGAPVNRELLGEPAKVFDHDEDSFVWTPPDPSTKR
jgi:hypothetical protein